MFKRLAIISSHPIQYNAPVFRALAAYDDLDIRVFYSWQGAINQPDVEFGRQITWDIPLTDGYPHSFIENCARHPGTHHFMGLRNPGMCGAIEAFRPDAILVYGWSSATHLGVLRHFHGKLPVLFRGDSTLQSSDQAWKAPLRRYVLSWVYSHVDRALYVGQCNRDYFLSHGLCADQLTWAPHSVEIGRFSADDTKLQIQADRQRAAMGVHRDACVFLFAGKFVPRKQPHLLIEAFSAIADASDGIPPHLVLVGAGPLEAELRLLSRGRDDIHFVGFKNQSEMPLAYRIGDVFVLPSSRETWGLAVNEAMACYRSVIVSDRVGCAPDLASDPRFSTTFTSGSCTDLAGALAASLKPRTHIREAGQLAQQFIARWSTEAAASAIAEGALREMRYG